MRVSIIPLIVRKLRKALAIVQDTNTATRNIDAGKFVMWKGELCKALSAITMGDTLSSTNLEACSDGGLNELNSNLAALGKRLAVVDITRTTDQFGQFTIPSGIDRTKIISMWCTNKNRAFVITTGSTTGVVYGPNNSSLTADTLRVFASQSVDIRILYDNT